MHLRTNILILFCFGLFALIETNIIRQNKQKNISIVACAISRLVIFIYFSPRRLILFFTLYLNWWIMLVFLFLYKITVFSSKGKFVNSAISDWDFTYFKGFNICYILLLNSPQALENTGFIAGELSIIVSLVLYRPLSVYELWQGQIQGHKMSSGHLLCADRFTTSSGCWLWTDHSGTKSGSGDQENYIKQYNTK